MKNKINLFFTKHKKNYKRILLLGLILLGAFLLFTIARGINNEKVRKENLVLEEKQQEELEKLLKEIGGQFYEEFYYLQVGKTEKERINFVKKYKESGISTNLKNLEVSGIPSVQEKLKKFVNEITKEECDKEKTTIQIKPLEPYGIKDYEISANLVCNLNN